EAAVNSVLDKSAEVVGRAQVAPIGLQSEPTAGTAPVNPQFSVVSEHEPALVPEAPPVSERSDTRVVIDNNIETAGERSVDKRSVQEFSPHSHAPRGAASGGDRGADLHAEKVVVAGKVARGVKGDSGLGRTVPREGRIQFRGERITNVRLHRYGNDRIET